MLKHININGIRYLCNSLYLMLLLHTCEKSWISVVGIDELKWKWKMSAQSQRKVIVMQTNKKPVCSSQAVHCFLLIAYQNVYLINELTKNARDTETHSEYIFSCIRFNHSLLLFTLHLQMTHAYAHFCGSRFKNHTLHLILIFPILN